jgi:uncharacterized protein (TIRG00374 family)
VGVRRSEDPARAQAHALDPSELGPTVGISTRPSRHLAVLALVFAATGFGLMFAYSDGQKLLRAASGVSWPRLAAPIGATLVSYFLMALSYEGIAAAAGSRIGLTKMLRITFVSNTVNYLVATGGLSGFALRMYFFSQSGIPVGRAVTISLVQGLLTNLVLLVFLVMGFWFLVINHTLSTAALVSASILLAVFVAATLLCVLLIIHRRVRRRVLFYIAEIGHRLARRFLPKHRAPRRVRLWRLQHNVNQGLEFMLSSYRLMVLPTLYIVLDWVVTLGVLWGSFWCVGQRISVPLVVVGFAVGILLSMVSLAPGGIGVMEGSMTTIFVALGKPLETTVIAVLIFRFAYYAVPFLLSIAFFRGMMRAAGAPPLLAGGARA